jgi:hypothetical protein
MITSRILLSTVGAMGAVALGAVAVQAAAPAAPAAVHGAATVIQHARPAKVLSFTNTMDTFHMLDVAPAGLSAGDTYQVGSHVSSGNVRGHTAASCVITTAASGGVRQCEIDFVLRGGIITTRGITDMASVRVTLVVTGGTGAYWNAGGTGSLTPTKTGSRVVLRLR